MPGRPVWRGESEEGWRIGPTAWGNLINVNAAATAGVTCRVWQSLICNCPLPPPRDHPSLQTHPTRLLPFPSVHPTVSPSRDRPRLSLSPLHSLFRPSVSFSLRTFEPFPPPPPPPPPPSPPPSISAHVAARVGLIGQLGVIKRSEQG